MPLTSDTKFVISILVATALFIGGGAYFASKKAPSTEGRIIADTLVNRLAPEDAQAIGPKDAKVTFVEFADFQCPACASIHPTLKELKEKYKDASVRFVFRHYPLPQHPHALKAAEAAVEAGKHNKFWEYHDQLFENQSVISPETLVAFAEKLEIPKDAFVQALDSNANEAIVRRDITDGGALGVRGTPALFINNMEYKGKYSVEEMSKAIDAELAK
ncbi:MAG: DsbA family protein [bacterium]|nr:DsbA family protein [bacterium]